MVKTGWLPIAAALLICFSLTTANAQTKGLYNILRFGARQGKSFNSQKAIQAAIDECSKAGGGIVLIPAGTYYTSTIYLKSNINLKLNGGAVLVAIGDKSLYRNAKPGLQEAGDSFIPALLVARNIKHFSITGDGVIRGDPEFYYTTVKDTDTYPGWNENAMKSGVSMQRPWVKDPKISLVYISGCENVLLSGVSILNSPNWSCHIQWSRNVEVNGIKIMSSLKEGVNSDGLDIDGCKRVRVSNCTIETGDDAICLKTTKQGSRSESCEDVMINNCNLSSSSCALKLGTESHADFRHITFTHCTISNSNRGIGIIIRDGGIVSDVSFSNITLDCKRKPFFWWGNGEAFHFNVLKRNPDSKPGKIEHVVLNNISGVVEGTSLIKGSGNDNFISNISISKVNLTLRAESEKDKRTTHAIAVSCASDIAFRNIKITWDLTAKEPLWRNALYAGDVNGLLISGFGSNQQTLQNGYAEISLYDVKNVSIKTGPTGKNSIELKGNSKNVTVSQRGGKADIDNKLNNKGQLKYEK